MNKHTPAPWKVVKFHTDHYVIDYDGRAPDQLMITDTWGDEPYVEKENAEHIVKCVNERDMLINFVELVAAGNLTTEGFIDAADRILEKINS